MSKRVVIIDDEPNMGKILGKRLVLEGYECVAFDSPREGVDHVRNHGADIVLSDLRMPGMTGEEVLGHIGALARVIIMTGYGTVDSAMRCVRAGAFDYVTKPIDWKALLAAMRQASAQPAEKKSEASTSEVGREILGESPEIDAVRRMIAKIAPSESAVLLTGESGTGKELAARAVHRLSPRAANRFVAINCASIPENLIESELFGHEKGAFTGAHERKIGLVEASAGGTLFLDEIGELPLAMQAKLLRMLQEREISRVGSVDNIAVDIRVIAATNRRLKQAVEEGEFREDLYYRLNVLKVKLPPLRERRGDIVLLAKHFIRHFGAREGRSESYFDSEALEKMKKMEWPGNVRELRNFVERAVVLAESDVITSHALDELAMADSHTPMLPMPTMPTPAEGEDLLDYRLARDRFEAEYIRGALRHCGGNVSDAAKAAGMSRRTFYDKLEKLGIEVSEFKE